MPWSVIAGATKVEERPSRLVPAALLQPHYLAFFTGQTLSLIGTNAQRVALPWLMWQAFGSELLLGLALSIESSAALIVCYFSGIATDRMSRLWLVSIAKSMSAIHAGALAYFAFTGGLTEAFFLLLSCFHGISVGLNQPVRIHATVTLVSKEHAPSALALDAVASNGAIFIGPLVAALTIYFFDARYVFLLNLISYAPMFVAIYAIRHRLKEKISHLHSEIQSDPKAIDPNVGYYLFARFLIATCAFPLQQFIAPLVSQAPHDQKFTFGLFSTSMGIGALGVGLVLSYIGSKRLAQILLRPSDVLILLVSVLVPLCGVSYLGALLLLLYGALTAFSRIGGQVILQANTRSRRYGRTMSIWWIVITGGQALGALLIGWVAQESSLAWAIAIVGITGLFILAGTRFVMSHSLQTRGARKTGIGL